MPPVSAEMRYVFKIYNRCRANKCLPRAGGLMDQPAWLMELFAVIDECREEKAKEDRDRLDGKIRLEAKRV